jgi:hypothetical protein
LNAWRMTMTALTKVKELWTGLLNWVKKLWNSIFHAKTPKFSMERDARDIANFVAGTPTVQPIRLFVNNIERLFKHIDGKLGNPGELIVTEEYPFGINGHVLVNNVEAIPAEGDTQATLYIQGLAGLTTIELSSAHVLDVEIEVTPDKDGTRILRSRYEIAFDSAIETFEA